VVKHFEPYYTENNNSPIIHRSHVTASLCIVKASKMLIEACGLPGN